MYMRPQLEEVPIERLIKNLSDLAEKNPKDARIRFNLARVHAMAYALKTDKTQIEKGKEDRGAWFGFEAKHVPFSEVKQTDNVEQLKKAKEQLELAIAAYKKAIELDPQSAPAQLGYAWCLEQAGKKEEAIKEYRAAIELGWKTEEKSFGGLGNRWIVTEAAGYLKPLLDPKKDKAELAQLDERIEILNNKPRAVTPIAIPLKAGLSASDLEDRTAQVRFDADGSGLPQTWSWIKPNAAWLVYDQRGLGKPDSALQLFGNVTFWCFWDNGYEAMRSLDNNHDGKLAGNELQHLALWQDTNSNGVADAGEVKPLAEHGIVGLSCDYQFDSAHQDRIPFSPAGAIYKNGETRATYDLLLHSR
jgi:tetratricopeptide (TPR) repeat protein